MTKQITAFSVVGVTVAQESDIRNLCNNRNLRNFFQRVPCASSFSCTDPPDTSQFCWAQEACMHVIIIVQFDWSVVS